MTKQPLWSFERFESGVSFGSVEVPLDERRIKLWQEIYGELVDEIIPEGLLVAAMMEAYIKAIQPRPKGNIHAAQKITFTNIKPLRGDALSVVLTCVHKEIKKSRRWIRFGAVIRTGDAIVMSGEIRAIWAS